MAGTDLFEITHGTSLDLTGISHLPAQQAQFNRTASLILLHSF